MNRETFKQRSFAETFELISKMKGEPLYNHARQQVNQGAASRLFKIPQPNFYRWLKAGITPQDDNIKIMAAKLGVTPAQLRGEEPIPTIDKCEHGSPQARAAATQNFHRMEVRKVPLISSVQAGHWAEAIDTFQPGDADEWIETSAKVSSQAFALRVTGDSMVNPYGNPSIPEGAIVIIDPNIEATSGKIVVARLTDSMEVTLKRLVIDGPNTYLKPLNPDYKAIQVNGNCVIVGVARKVEFDL